MYCAVFTRLFGGKGKRGRKWEGSNFGQIKGWQINKREQKERAKDTKFYTVTLMRVNGAVLRDMTRVQDLHIHIPYPECNSRNSRRNIGRFSALIPVSTTKNTITVKYISCLIFLLTLKADRNAKGRNQPPHNFAHHNFRSLCCYMHHSGGMTETKVSHGCRQPGQFTATREHPVCSHSNSTNFLRPFKKVINGTFLQYIHKIIRLSAPNFFLLIPGQPLSFYQTNEVNGSKAMEGAQNLALRNRGVQNEWINYLKFKNLYCRFHMTHTDYQKKNHT